MVESRLIGGYSAIGIRPTIDGRVAEVVCEENFRKEGAVEWILKL